jgi:hypothetical protein
MELFGVGAVLSIVFFLLGIFLIPFIFFLITQQNTLKAIQPQNRTMSPGEVWLQLIPLFHIVWRFIVVKRIAESIRNELSSGNAFSFEESNYSPYLNDEKPTQQIGMAYCILGAVSYIPILGSLAGLAELVCWIIYWVKLSEYKNQIESKKYAFYPTAPASVEQPL